jgi:DNA ligase-1
MKQAHRKHNAQADDSVYHIFDFIPVANFMSGGWGLTQQLRFAALEHLRERLTHLPNIKIVQGIEVDLSTAEGHDQMRRYAEDQVAAGYEGIMIKDLQAPYECKRASHWMKWKPTITVDLEVINVEEGTGRNLGRLGALVCEGSDNGRTITVNVGSGFSDIDRDSFWDAHINGGNLVGQVVEVEADVVTQNKDGTYSLRFPRFVRFRGFDKGEKL